MRHLSLTRPSTSDGATRVALRLRQVLDLESTNVKALYRRAQAYVGTQDYDMAEWDVKKALDLDPDNK